EARSGSARRLSLSITYYNFHSFLSFPFTTLLQSEDLCADPFLTFTHLPAYPTPTSPPPLPPPPISNLRSSRRRQRSLLLDPTFLILRSEGF
ncbi:hypothetical protein CFP56_005697, partial [Quercus suber]